MSQRPVPFVKGHGSRNDFVLLPDPEGLLELDAALVRAICDRRGGLGADGVLRAVLCTQEPDAATMAEQARWFMDYRNADGSVAQMCGNGMRVFARYLVDVGLAELGEQWIASRAGVRRVIVHPGGEVTVDMGPVLLGRAVSAQLGSQRIDGVSASVGNPHLVWLTDTPVAGIELSQAPVLDPVDFPDGANVEVVNTLGDPVDGADLHIRLRVHERGVGETEACGTGACAAAGVALGGSSGVVAVDQPGGRVLVTVSAVTSVLAGPAVLVASGLLEPAWFGSRGS